MRTCCRSSILVSATAIVALAGCAADAGVAAIASRRSEEPQIVVVPPVSPIADGVSPERLGDDVELGPIDPVPAPPDVIVDASEPRPASAAVVGDSLTVSARDEIESALATAGFGTVAVDGRESRRMTHGGSDLPPGIDVVADILERSDPELWVIALGTNDVASVGNLDGFRSEMRSILDLIPPDVPVIWVDLWIRDRPDDIVVANRLIRTELRTWTGGATVVDWHAHGLDEGVITGDGVHLTELGQQLFADSIVNAIDEMYAG